MDHEPAVTPPDPRDAGFKSLEARVARIEAYLRLDEAAAVQKPAAAAPGSDEDLEFRIGQEWFAKVGMAALGVGVAFTLSLPYAGLPAAAPSAVGYALSAGLFLLARFCPPHLEVVSGFARATAMALFYFSGLRLCFFGERHALAAGSAAAGLVLAASAAANVAIAYRRRSPWLFGLALVTGYATSLAAGSPAFGLVLVALFSLAAAAAGARLGLPALIVTAMPLAYAAYILLALGNPLLGGAAQFAAVTPWAPAVVLVCLAAFSMGLLRATRGDREAMMGNAAIFLNASVGFLVYLAHTLACYQEVFVAAQVGASAVLLALAFPHARQKDGIGSFVCAMSGFAALSFAIMKATHPPDVFVWLSVQSVIVVAMAIWLRSRFIIVANFVIFLGILASYVAVAGEERGISIGFGAVALVTARLLGWQQQRLELRTGLMRNAYLVVAFFVFPYALYHLVPGAWVGLAWVGAALLYYAIAAILHNPKYRYMAHATLLLTALYLCVAGISRLEPLFRNLSFLVLGAVLVVVSLVFTRLRTRARARGQGGSNAGPPGAAGGQGTS
jgi:hypothetical protein